MARIERIEVTLVDLPPAAERVDAIQSFVSQETPIVTIRDSEGASGTGYSYTIGTGGPSIMALIRHTLAPALIGRDPDRIEGIWRDLLFSTHATSVGAVTSLALAAIDTALWDMKCRKAGLPLWKAAGGARESIPVYSTECGWLQIETEALVAGVLEAKAAGFTGAKVKIGREHLSEDAARLAAVRAAAGDGFEIMTDANQAFSVSEALRRARVLEDHGVAWFEEPLPADDVGGHAQLARSTSVPVAVGESLYSLGQFKDYLVAGAASVVQVDVARIGGITPWLKVAALAEAHSVAVCPHFLMELHLPLVCAASAGRWLEYIPQMGAITSGTIRIDGGRAWPSDAPGLGARVGLGRDREQGADLRHDHGRAVMQRMGMMIGIEPDRIDEYRRLHAAAWPEVLKQIRDSNIRNYTIFLREPENVLFGYWEYHGDDFAADMASMAENEKTREWWTLTDPCQVPLASRDEGEQWSMMEEVFHTD